MNNRNLGADLAPTPFSSRQFSPKQIGLHLRGGLSCAHLWPGWLAGLLASHPLWPTLSGRKRTLANTLTCSAAE